MRLEMRIIKTSNQAHYYNNYDTTFDARFTAKIVYIPKRETIRVFW